jgi:hypothetical protein
MTIQPLHSAVRAVLTALSVTGRAELPQAFRKGEDGRDLQCFPRLSPAGGVNAAETVGYETRTGSFAAGPRAGLLVAEDIMIGAAVLDVGAQLLYPPWGCN